jgi:hypothetical protein
MIPNKQLIQIIWQSIRDLFSFETIHLLCLFLLVMYITSL